MLNTNSIDDFIAKKPDPNLIEDILEDLDNGKCNVSPELIVYFREELFKYLKFSRNPNLINLGDHLTKNSKNSFKDSNDLEGKIIPFYQLKEDDEADLATVIEFPQLKSKEKIIFDSDAEVINLFPTKEFDTDEIDTDELESGKLASVLYMSDHNPDLNSLDLSTQEEIKSQYFMGLPKKSGLRLVK